MYCYVFQLLHLWLHQTNIQIGDPDKIVEIDEAKIEKRKYNRGRIVEGQRVFGAIERHSKRIFIFPISDRTTLLPIIKKHILPDIIIHSDE